MNYGIGNVKGAGGVSNTMLTTTTDATENNGTYTLDLTYLSETPKVNDYVAYVNSGVLTTLYQVSAIGSTEATLEKIGDIGGGGGGKQLYQHNIIDYYTGTNTSYCAITIINDSSEKIDTKDKLINYLWSKGYTDSTKALMVNGFSLNQNNSQYNRDYIAIFVNSSTDTYLSMVQKKPTYGIDIVLNSISLTSMTDEVIPL